GSTIYSRTHRTKKNELLLKLINYNLHKTTKIETLIQGFLQSRILYFYLNISIQYPIIDFYSLIS
ncbi:MAG: hypothetical protein ABH950_02245, partial [Candidatus Altiarchaeota archaeon]